MIGYFQVDTAGEFSTPLLPRSVEETSVYGISGQEKMQRLALQTRIQKILSDNRLVQDREGEAYAGKGSRADRPVRRDRPADISASLSGADDNVSGSLLKKKAEKVKS